MAFAYCTASQHCRAHPHYGDCNASGAEVGCFWQDPKQKIVVQASGEAHVPCGNLEWGRIEHDPPVSFVPLRRREDAPKL